MANRSRCPASTVVRLLTLCSSRYQLHTDEFVRAGGHVMVGDEEQVGERLADRLRQWRDENYTIIL